MRTPLYLLHLGGWAIITWLLAGQVLGQGNQVLHRLCCCDCASFRPAPQADSACHPAERESEAPPLPTQDDLPVWAGPLSLHGGKYQAQCLKLCYPYLCRDRSLPVKNITRVDVYVFNCLLLPMRIKRNHETRMSLLGSESVQ